MGYEDDTTDFNEEINLLEANETKITDKDFDNDQKVTKPTNDNNKKEIAAKLQEYLTISEQRISQLESQIEQIPNVIQNTLSQVIQSSNQEQTQNNSVSEMPPELKAQMLSQIIQTLTQAYATVKGGGNQQVNPNQPDFNGMLQDWSMRLFQYSLDNIAQNVYQFKLPPPDNLRTRVGQPPINPGDRHLPQNYQNHYTQNSPNDNNLNRRRHSFE